MKPYSKNLNTPIVPNVLVPGQTMLTQKKPGSMKNWNQEDLQLLEAITRRYSIKKGVLKNFAKFTGKKPVPEPLF